MIQVTSVAMDGSRVVSGSWDKTVKVWNVETGELLHTFRGIMIGERGHGWHIHCVSASSDEIIVAATLGEFSTDPLGTTREWPRLQRRSIRATTL